MNESTLVKKQIALIKRRGGHANKIHGGPQQRAGISDILGCYRGYFLALESKTPKNKRGLTPLQSRYLERIREAGGIAEEVRSVREVSEILDGIDGRVNGDG